VLLSGEAFKSIVHDGASVPNGMPTFGELTDEQLSNLRQYLRTEAQTLRKANASQNQGL
jgi:quinohemoprotein ethanol dehydrogenase